MCKHTLFCSTPHLHQPSSHLGTASLPSEHLSLDLLGPLCRLPPRLSDQVSAVVQTHLSDADDRFGVLVDECEHVVEGVEVCLFRVHADGRVESKLTMPTGSGVVVDARAQFNNLSNVFLREDGGGERGGGTYLSRNMEHFATMGCRAGLWTYLVVKNGEGSEIVSKG